MARYRRCGAHGRGRGRFDPVRHRPHRDRALFAPTRSCRNSIGRARCSSSMRRWSPPVFPLIAATLPQEPPYEHWTSPTPPHLRQGADRPAVDPDGGHLRIRGRARRVVDRDAGVRARAVRRLHRAVAARSGRRPDALHLVRVARRRRRAARAAERRRRLSDRHAHGVLRRARRGGGVVLLALDPDRGRDHRGASSRR